MDNAEFETAKKESESWYWWGVPTFFRCPWKEDPADCDIALVGVPHSAGNGSTERDQHLGPRAVRDVSGYYRRAHGVHNFAPFEESRIHDLGDVPLPESMNNEACMHHIEAFYKRLDAVNINQGVRLVDIKTNDPKLQLLKINESDPLILLVSLSIRDIESN
jgi:guanidinopropionase